MDLKVRQCFLKVDDHDRAIAFYRDALGFEVRDDVDSNGGRSVTLGLPAQPDIDVVLMHPTAQPGVSAQDADAMRDLLARGLLGDQLTLSTTHLERTFERAEGAGADVVQEPMDQPEGARDCAFLDPAGNVIRVSQDGRPTPTGGPAGTDSSA
jgi:predicted enzyme related to lactoylglutathione lyase